MPIASGNVAKGADARDIVAEESLQTQGGLVCRVAGRPLFEALGVVLVLTRMIERHTPKLAHKRILLGVPHHGREVLPQCVVLRTLLKRRHGLQRLGCGPSARARPQR